MLIQKTKYGYTTFLHFIIKGAESKFTDLVTESEKIEKYLNIKLKEELNQQCYICKKINENFVSRELLLLS